MCSLLHIIYKQINKIKKKSFVVLIIIIIIIMSRSLGFNDSLKASQLSYYFYDVGR